MGAVFIITKFKTESPAVKKNGKRKRPAPNRHGSKIKSAASQKNSGVIAAPTGVAEIVQEEVCIVPAPPVCLLPVCSYARLTAYCGILPTRSPILPERDHHAFLLGTRHHPRCYGKFRIPYAPRAGVFSCRRCQIGRAYV